MYTSIIPGLNTISINNKGKELMIQNLITAVKKKATAIAYGRYNATRIQKRILSNALTQVTKDSLLKKRHETKSRLLGYGNFKLNAMPHRPNVKSGQYSLQWEITNFHLTIDGIGSSTTPLIQQS